MADPFTCPRCGRKVETAWPSGEPVVVIHAARFYAVARRDGSTSTEPAGHTPLVTMCLRCDLAVWPRVEQAVGSGARG